MAQYNVVITDYYNDGYVQNFTRWFVNLDITEQDARTRHNRFRGLDEYDFEFNLLAADVKQMKVYLRDYSKQMIDFLKTTDFCYIFAIETKHNEIKRNICQIFNHSIKSHGFRFKKFDLNSIIESVYKVFKTNVEPLVKYLKTESISKFSGNEIKVYQKLFDEFGLNIVEQLSKFGGIAENLYDSEVELNFESFKTFKPIKGKFDNWVENENKVKERNDKLEERIKELEFNSNKVLSELSTRDERIMDLTEELSKLRTDSESEVKSLKEVIDCLKSKNNELEIKVENMEQMITQKQESIEGLKSKMSEINDNFDNQLMSKQNEVKTLLNRIESLELKDTKRGQKLENVGQEVTQIYEKNREQQEVIDGLETDLKTHNNRIETLEIIGNEMGRTVKSGEQELLHLNKNIREQPLPSDELSVTRALVQSIQLMSTSFDRLLSQSVVSQSEQKVKSLLSKKCTERVELLECWHSECTQFKDYKLIEELKSENNSIKSELQDMTRKCDILISKT